VSIEADLPAFYRRPCRPRPSSFWICSPPRVGWLVWGFGVVVFFLLFLSFFLSDGPLPLLPSPVLRLLSLLLLFPSPCLPLSTRSRVRRPVASWSAGVSRRCVFRSGWGRFTPARPSASGTRAEALRAFAGPFGTTARAAVLVGPSTGPSTDGRGWVVLTTIFNRERGRTIGRGVEFFPRPTGGWKMSRRRCPGVRGEPGRVKRR